MVKSLHMSYKNNDSIISDKLQNLKKDEKNANDNNLLNLPNITTTCYPNLWLMIQLYPDIGYIIDTLIVNYNVKIQFNVDATKLSKYNYMTSPRL